MHQRDTEDWLVWIQLARELVHFDLDDPHGREEAVDLAKNLIRQAPATSTRLMSDSTYVR